MAMNSAECTLAVMERLRIYSSADSADLIITFGLFWCLRHELLKEADHDCLYTS